jgi:hypothetical protein
MAISCVDIHCDVKGEGTSTHTVSPLGIRFTVLYTRKHCDRDKTPSRDYIGFTCFQTPTPIGCTLARRLVASHVPLPVYATLAPERLDGFYLYSLF